MDATDAAEPSPGNAGHVTLTAPSGDLDIFGVRRRAQANQTEDLPDDHENQGCAPPWPHLGGQVTCLVTGMTMKLHRWAEFVGTTSYSCEAQTPRTSSSAGRRRLSANARSSQLIEPAGASQTAGWPVALAIWSKSRS